MTRSLSLLMFLALGACVIRMPNSPRHLPFSSHDARDWYTLAARHSGQCLDVSGTSHSTGAAVIQHPWHGGENQLFRFVSVGKGFYNIVARHSGQCLDIDSGTAERGKALIQHPCHGGPNQQFKAN